MADGLAGEPSQAACRAQKAEKGATDRSEKVHGKTTEKGVIRSSPNGIRGGRACQSDDGGQKPDVRGALL
jgi:hypothetical protein